MSIRRSALCLAVILGLTALAACTRQTPRPPAEQAASPSSTSELSATGRTPATGDQPPAVPGSSAAPSHTAAGTRRYVVVAGDSKAAYRVTEKFVNRPNPNEAVGVSTAVQGELVTDAAGTLLQADVKVDLRELKSDAAMRDRRLRTAWLESDKYPWARFSLTKVEGGPLRDGQPASLKLTGEVVVREVSRTLTWEVTATLQGDTLRLQGETHTKLTAFGIEPPHILGVLQVEDPLTLQIDLVARAEE